MADNMVNEMIKEGTEMIADKKEDLVENVVEPVAKASHEVLKKVAIAGGSFLAGMGVMAAWDEHKKYAGMSKEEKKAFKEAEKARKKQEKEQRIAEFKKKFDKEDEVVEEDDIVDDEEEVIEE